MPFPTTHPALAQALAERKYDEPTSVQAAVLEANAANADLLVSAQTGSGKTVAFGLAMADTLFGEDGELPPAGQPLALIVAPTRELALQVHRELSWLYEKARAQVMSCVGGMDPRHERRGLNAGTHIVVGTPGRLRDHLERGALDISALRIVVLDEADEMLDLGFREDLEFLLDAMPPERRTLLFSATIPKEIASLAKRFQKNAVRIDTVASNTSHADIEYQAVRIAPNDMEHAVVNLLRYRDSGASLVFCATREAVNRLHASLAERGFAAVALSGEFSQAERNHALQALRDGRAKVCVATDVAARGLDLPDLGLVIHSDLPRNRDTLLHRSGRTGRAGRKGVCILLVPHTKRRQAERLFLSARIDAAWVSAPTPEQIRKQDQERLLDHPVFASELAEEDIELAQALIAKRTPEEIATALARIYRAQLPAAEDLFESGGGNEKPSWTPVGNLSGDGRPGESRPPREDMQWFRMNAGRFNNADPRWLIPLICRLGHITKKEIGAIRIFDRETKFEIVATAARAFITAVEKANDPEVSIAAAGGPPQGERRPDRPEGGDRRPPHKGPPKGAGPGGPGGKPPYKPPYKKAGAPSGDRPAYVKSDKPYAKSDKPPYVKSDKPRGPKPPKRT
jgi:ATP-dependent RNA helicase DeaD